MTTPPPNRHKALPQQYSRVNRRHYARASACYSNSVVVNSASMADMVVMPSSSYVSVRSALPPYAAEDALPSILLVLGCEGPALLVHALISLVYV